MSQIEVRDFPDVYQKYPLDLLIQCYIQGPPRLEHALSGLTLEEMKRRPIPGKWSILEIVFHLTDSEIVALTRIKKVIAEGEAVLPCYDQDAWVDALRYNDSKTEDLQSTIRLFTQIRTEVGKILVSQQDIDWKKSGIHPEFGMVTLRNLVELYADHSERHIEQILDRRALLDKPVELPCLLESRLY